MHPVLFEIFGIPISPYGLLIACGLLVAVYLGRRRARAIGIPEDSVLDVVFWGVIAGFVGARIAFIIVNFGDFVQDPMAMIFSRQGFVFLGGLIAAAPVVWWVICRWGVRFTTMADLVAPPLALGHAFGRTGCFCAGCCYGKPTDAPWGVEFPRFIDWGKGFIPTGQEHIDSAGMIWGNTTAPVGHVVGSPAFYEQALTGQCSWDSLHSVAVHPTQLYDVAIQLALFALLMVLWHHRKFHGMVFLAYLWIYPITRIVLEFFRGDLERGIWFGGLSTSQVISAALVGVALALTIFHRRVFAPVDAPPMVGEPPKPKEPDKAEKGA